jgi:sugar phosphate isomerase/epimerase
MPEITFMTANFVARQTGYRVTQGWSEGDQATNATFQPIDTYAQRLDQLLAEVSALGFRALDLWTAHLHYAWATAEHVDIARRLLAHHGLQGVSYAGWFGSTPAEFEAACRVASAVGLRILGGTLDLTFRDEAIRLLRAYGLRLAIENHPEKTPEEMLAKIGAGAGGLIGTAVDTGWYATQGYDAAEAIRRLGPALFHVHLKDILAAGAHDTCRYGAGIVPLEACVRAALDAGYTGAFAVEHEPYLYDPTDDVRASAQMLRSWLSQAEVNE